MPINITGEFQPSDGVHGFDLYDPQDIKAGNINVILQAIAGGAFKGGSHATAPVGELVAQVKTSTGAPNHSATEGTICWNSVDDTFWVNNNGTTGWTQLGVAGDSDQMILASRSFMSRETTPPRLKAGTNVTITQRADEFEIAAAGGGTPGDSDQMILPSEAFGRRVPLIPRLKAGANITIIRRADEFEIASTGGGAAGDSDQAILPGQAFDRRVPLIPRLKAGANITITRRADEHEIAAPTPVPGDSDQSILSSRAFTSREPVPPRLKAGTNVTITRRADEFEIAAGSGTPGDSDQMILPTRNFSRSIGERPGGAVGEVQFNNSGIFGGIPILRWDGTNLIVVTNSHLQFRDDTTEIHSSGAGFLRLRASSTARLQTGEFLVSSDDLARTILDVLDVAGAVNYLELKPSISTAPVLLTARGTDASVSMNFVPKGVDGRLQVNGDEVATVLSGQVFGA